MAKKKNKADGKDIAGRIITIFFVLLLIGGAYYLYTLFKNVEVSSETLAGKWKLGSNPVTYYEFEMDENSDPMKGRIKTYTQKEGSAETNDHKTYTYELVKNERGTYYDIHMRETKNGKIVGEKEEIITVTKLSTAQMYIRMHARDQAMVRADAF